MDATQQPAVAPDGLNQLFGGMVVPLPQAFGSERSMLEVAMSFNAGAGHPIGKIIHGFDAKKTGALRTRAPVRIRPSSTI